MSIVKMICDHVAYYKLGRTWITHDACSMRCAKMLQRIDHAEIIAEG